jgi:hypothetical protein
MGNRPVREAVGVFRDFQSLQATADELLTAGFDRSDLSLLADPETVRRKRGRAFASVRDAEDDPAAPFRAYAGLDSRIEAEGALIGGIAYAGAMAAAIVAAGHGLSLSGHIAWVAAAGAAGGLVGLWFARMVENRHRGYLKALLDAGGLLLWVRAQDDEHERRALTVMRHYGASDVHAHDLPALVFQPGGGVSRELAWLEKPLLKALGGR